MRATSFDTGYSALERLCSEASASALLTNFSESDTRAKIIDRLLIEVLGWPEAAITREPHVDSGYIDYVLKCPHPLMVIEAKRSGVTFTLPVQKSSRRLVLRRLAAEGSPVGDAVRQARRYADDSGIEYGCATNGAQWIVFHAITRKQAWLDGKAVVFYSLDDVREHFVEFWNLLSFEAVQSHSLRNSFSASARDRPVFTRPLQSLSYADAPLERNPFAPELQALINSAFGDLGGWRDPDLLRKCYVWERNAHDFQKSVDLALSSSLPGFARRAGFHHLVLTAETSGEVDHSFIDAVKAGRYGTTILLLGQIGSGKTTFLQRFMNVTAPNDVRAKSALVYVPFTDAPPDPAGVQAFIRKRVLSDLQERHPDVSWQNPAVLRGVYKDDLDTLKAGLWSALPEPVVAEREAIFLEQRTALPDHADRILKFLRSAGVPVIIIIDNMDHHSPPQQEDVFLHAHAISRNFDAIVLVALREETFFRGMQAGAFNAYSNIRYSVSPPDVRKVLSRRLDYVLDALNEGEEALHRLTRAHMSFHIDDLRIFLQQARRCLSGKERNPAIAQFLDNLAQGNMRLALDMFARYLISGSTKVSWIIDITQREGSYRVAEHEFIRAVMLGDYQLYRDARSSIPNLFEVSASPAASNLTASRLLTYLSRRSDVAHPEGPGFLSVDSLLGTFADIFGDTEDVVFHCERLLRKKLLEVDTRSPDSLIGARAIRVTRSGTYFLRTLCRRFQYLDLVVIDTPIWSPSVVHAIVGRVNGDLLARIERVECLLAYLYAEELRSLSTASHDLAEQHFGPSIVNEIAAHYEKDLFSRVVPSAKLNPGRVEDVRGHMREWLATELGLTQAG